MPHETLRQMAARVDNTEGDAVRRRLGCEAAARLAVVAGGNRRPVDVATAIADTQYPQVQPFVDWVQAQGRRHIALNKRWAMYLVREYSEISGSLTGILSYHDDQLVTKLASGQSNLNLNRVRDAHEMVRLVEDSLMAVSHFKQYPGDELDTRLADRIAGIRERFVNRTESYSALTALLVQDIKRRMEPNRGVLNKNDALAQQLWGTRG
ncbi:MAG: hypothetical protein H6922_03705 [Pseudomonadaceae bacterium]|nr:hypothetical protein [Pseudomonadaceae bacterium]